VNTQIDGAATMEREAYESFVVRIWRQQVTNAQERQWCGEIEQIQNGLRWRFHTLTDLLTFLQQAAGDCATDTAPNPTPTLTEDADHRQY